MSDWKPGVEVPLTYDAEAMRLCLKGYDGWEKTIRFYVPYRHFKKFRPAIECAYSRGMLVVLAPTGEMGRVYIRE